MTSVFINQCRRDTRTCCLPGVVKLKQTAAKASDSLPLSVRHLFLRPADKEQKNEIDFFLTCFQLHTQESGIGRACRPRKEDEGQFFTSYRCLEQECAVEQEASYITVSWRLTPAAGGVSQKRPQGWFAAGCKNPKRLKGPEERAVDPDMTAVTQCVASVNYLLHNAL